MEMAIRRFSLVHIIWLVFGWQCCLMAKPTFGAKLERQLAVNVDESVHKFNFSSRYYHSRLHRKLNLAETHNHVVAHSSLESARVERRLPRIHSNLRLSSKLGLNIGVSNVVTETPTTSGSKVFDVTAFGAKANGKADNAEAFMKTWVEACQHGTTNPKVVIPQGTFLVGPVVFAGPCKSSGSITVEVKGTVLATTDISEYSSPEWFSFENINGLILTGGGVFDGQGASAWQYNNCKKDIFCQSLPISIKFSKMNHTTFSGITSLNSKAFHTSVYNCYNFTANNLNIKAPGNSPNTDGMHISASKLVHVSNSVIATGDDCVSIGQGTENIVVTNITCGPGHGISVGSLGKYSTEKSVNDISVKNCTLINTTNGARIKTWAGETTGSATKIIYEDIIMNNVENPIIIDQTYGTKEKKVSKWKISDVHFRNIRGSSATNIAVNLECSSLFPCEGVELKDIDLALSGTTSKKTGISSSCFNAKISALGLQNPPACTS